MTIKRKRKEWEMTGEVIGIRPKKIAQGPMKGVMNYFLDVKLVFSPIETFPGYFHVMKEKLRNNDIWDSVVSSNFWQGKYIFTSAKYGETWRLLDWKEVRAGRQAGLIEALPMREIGEPAFKPIDEKNVPKPIEKPWPF